MSASVAFRNTVWEGGCFNFSRIFRSRAKLSSNGYCEGKASRALVAPTYSAMGQL